jgi:hypothetical protein
MRLLEDANYLVRLARICRPAIAIGCINADLVKVKNAPSGVQPGDRVLVHR